MSVGSDRAAAAVELAFREDWGRVVAALIRRTGDWDLAEDSAAEAFAAALPAWTRDGVPERPGAWLTTAAGNRALDRLRRSRRGAELLQRLGRDPLGPAGDAEEDPRMAGLFEDGEEIEDDRLRLIFTCCHPALALQARVALTLRTLAGLSTGEIARAFLVSEPTMAKRLTRAKARIAGAAIAEGLAVLDRSLGAGSVGPYGLQAAIAACHARAPTAQRTDWAQIAELYDRLLAVAPSPVVALNRAVAVAMTGDLRGGLALVDALAASGALDGYHLLEATRADLLRRAGDREPARAAYERALTLAGSGPERRFLARRLREL